MTLAQSSDNGRAAAVMSGESSLPVDADLESALVEGLAEHMTVSSDDDGWTDLPNIRPLKPESGKPVCELEEQGTGEDLQATLQDGLSDEPPVSSARSDKADRALDLNPPDSADNSNSALEEEIGADFETALLPSMSSDSETLRATLEDPGPSANAELSYTALRQSKDTVRPTILAENAESDAHLPETAEVSASEPVVQSGPIDYDLEIALLEGLADEPETPPERSDDPAISDDSAPPDLASESAFEPSEPGPEPLFDFESAFIEGLPDSASTSFDDGDAPELSGTVSSVSETPSDAIEPDVATFPDAPEFPSELLDSLSEGPGTSSGDPEPPGLPAAPVPGDASLESAPARSSDLQDELSDTEIDTAASEELHDDADHRPAAALAFAADPETEGALREGLLRYRGTSPDRDDPQVWSGGLRAAVAALEDGHTSDLLIVDLDGIPYPAGAIHELAEVCEVGTVVIALGSDGSARAGREILLAGVSDYLVKPVTAAAIREAALRATGNGENSPGRGCVAGFAGTGGSGTTTIAAAAALHAAEQGRYVSILDLSRTVSAMALLLDVEPAPGLDQLFEAAGRSPPDPKLLDGVRTERSERISIYAYRLGPSLPPVPPMPALDWLLGQLRHRSQLVLVDGLDDPGTCFDLLGEVDLRVAVAEPTATGCGRAARMLDLLGRNGPKLFVQNHTRKFNPEAGTKLLTEAGVETAPDVVVPFDASLPGLASSGWPRGRLPRGLRKPIATLVDRTPAFAEPPAALAGSA